MGRKVNKKWHLLPSNDRLLLSFDVVGLQAQVPDSQGVILLTRSSADKEASLGIDCHGRQDRNGTQVSPEKRFERRLGVQVPPGDLRNRSGYDAVVAGMDTNRMDWVRLRPLVTLDLCHHGWLLEVELTDKAVRWSREDLAAGWIPSLDIDKVQWDIKIHF